MKFYGGERYAFAEAMVIHYVATDTWECNCRDEPQLWQPDPNGPIYSICDHILDSYLFSQNKAEAAPVKLTVEQMTFLQRNKITGRKENSEVLPDGRMAWKVFNGGSPIFSTVILHGDNKWSCDCARAAEVGVVQFGPHSCDHVQATFLHWKQAEAKKRTMQEQLLAHAKQVQETQALAQLRYNEEMEYRAQRQREEETVKPVPAEGFIFKPKRKITLED